MSFNQTQLDMFKNMPGIDDEADEADNSQQDMNTDDQGTADSTKETSEPAATTVAATKEPEANAAGNSNSGQDNKPTTPAAVSGPVRPDGLVAVPDPSNPKVSNLVDPRTGQVVVQAGAQRRLYDNMQRAQREAQTHSGRVQQLETELNAYKAANVAAAQYKLAPNEQVDAMRLMADFKANPAATLQKIVEEAQAAGIDLPFLQNGGMAPSVIEGMLDRKLAPLTAPQEQARVQAEQQAAAKEALDTFLEVHDTAEVHLPLIADMLSKNPKATLESCYTQIIQFAADHGLDYRRPLKEQIEARNATGVTPSNNPPAAAATNAPARNLPNGRSASAGTTNVEDVAEYGANDSWDTIIRNAVRRHGVNT